MNHRRRNLWRGRLAALAACAVGLAIVLSAGCGADAGDNAASNGGETETITIGLMAPMTGSLANDGETMENGAALAVKEINEAGGVAGYTFELKTVDVADQKQDLVGAAIQQLSADSSVKLLMTGYCSNNSWEIDTVAELGLPYITGGGSNYTADIISKDPAKYGTVWSIAPVFHLYETELPKLVEKWADGGLVQLRDRTAFIVTSDNPYSRSISTGLRKTLDSMDWNVVGEETVPFGTVNDWGTILAKIRKANPDLVVNTDYLPANDATFMKQFMNNPTDSLVFIQYGPSVPEFLDLTKETSTGVLYNLIGGPIDSGKWEKYQSFLPKYQESYNDKEPGTYGSMCYDTVYVYADALARVENADDFAAIGEAIGSTDMDICSGHLKFDQKTHTAMTGDEYIPIQFFQIWGGERYLISPDAFKTADFRQPPWMSE